jgi:spore coat protein A
MNGPDSTGAAPLTVVHLHGGHVPPESDGYPENTFLPGAQMTNGYPNNQDAATLWYHDHAMGITRLNVLMGLAGFYIIRDAVEAALGLPGGDYEIPIAIQDRSFNADGSFKYPAMWITSSRQDLVSGRLAYLHVNQAYRFRVLNSCNSGPPLGLSSGDPFW